jgi:uncharacterized membrane protein
MPFLNYSAVTSGKTVHVTGQCLFYGYSIQRDANFSGVTLVISDSAGTTGTNILVWGVVGSGSSVQGSFINKVFPHGIKCATGLRSQCVGAGGGGVTAAIYWD